LDVTAILSAMWSIGPFRAIRVWFGHRRSMPDREGAMDQIIPLP
jgi:hypothetical protein